MSNLKWMPLTGLNLSAANTAAAEKLRKFGFAVNCGEYGSDKYVKSELCIYDVLSQQETPKILIIAPASELYNWYRVLITGIGADFKMVNGSRNSLIFFDENEASLFLLSKEALFADNALKQKISKRFLWDLIVIDEEQSCSVPNYAEYQKNIIWNSKRLLVNTPFPARNPVDAEGLKALIKSVLDSGELSAKADSMEFGTGTSGLSDDSPVMRYYNAPAYSDDYKRQISFVDYEFDNAELSSFRRRMDLRTGLPAYSGGANIFEMYDCEKHDSEKKIYSKSFYSRSDVDDLMALDKKLESLIKLCGELLADGNNRIMIYCCAKETMDYLQKALSCIYGAAVSTARGELVRSDDITRKFAAKPEPGSSRIIIGTDELGTAARGMSTVNVVVNYELPMSPTIFDRRMTRHGFDGEGDRKFFIFRDKNGIFDTAILEKSLYLQLADAFCGELPTRNILLDIDSKGEYLNGLINDLKHILDAASGTDSCLDLAKQVRCEYPASEVRNIQNGSQLKEFAERMLRRLYDLFGIDENSSYSDISAAIGSLNGLCVMKNGRLVNAENRGKLAEGLDAPANLPFASEAVKGLADAKVEIDELHKSDDFHLRIKREISKLGDCIQYPVLYGIWKYRAREQGSDRSFKDYIKIYNDGF